MGRLTGVQRGARERFRRRVKGWAMEGHQVLDPSTELRSLHFGSALLCQPRVGPVAEIDLEQLQEVKVSKIQEVQIQEVHIHEVKTPEKAAHQPEERPQSDSKTRSRWSKAPTAPTRAEELARALELELEMDRRRSAPLELLGSSRIQLSPSVVFLVDALNEVLAQMKQHADRIDRLHSEALSKRGAALAKLQERLCRPCCAAPPARQRPGPCAGCLGPW
ncbi:unnamed protein product [Effrenium voratum]|nr:unnamed protein product [Effrenium voratum]